MPAYPVSVAANYFNMTNPSDDDILNSLQLTMALFLNYTGQAGPCFELSSAAPPGLTQNGWDYQCCTEGEPRARRPRRAAGTAPIVTACR